MKQLAKLQQISQNLMVIFFDKLVYKRPVVGYQGHIRRIPSDNIYGTNYQSALSQSEISKKELFRWKYRRKELGLDYNDSKKLPKLK